MSATITYCKRLVDNGQAAQTRNGENPKVTYLLQVAEYNADPLEVVRASWPGGVVPAGHVAPPPYNSAHPLNLGIVVINKTAKRIKDNRGKSAKYAWTLEVEWGPLEIGPVGNTGNSQNITVDIRNRSQTIYTQQCLSTINNAPNTPAPIRNVNGDIYPDPQEETIYDTEISVSYETLSINHQAWDDALNHINNDVVTLTLPVGALTYTRTFAKHTLLLESADRSITFSRTDPSQAKWHNQVKLVYRKDTWDRQLPEKGYRWYALVDPTAENDSDAYQLSNYQDHPEYLDSEGLKLDVGKPLVRTPPKQIKYETDLGTLLSTI